MNKSTKKIILRKMLILIIMMMLISGIAHAEEKHPIDKRLEDCMNKSKSVTSEMEKCLEAALEEWEAEISKYYRLLMDKLDEEPKKQLKESQMAWLRFKNAEFEFIPFYFQDFGSYIGPYARSHKIDIVKSRALQLRTYYNTITEIKADSD